MEDTDIRTALNRGQSGALLSDVELSGHLEKRRRINVLAIFVSLRHRDFRYLWFGTLFSSAGQWIQQITLGWLVYDITGSSVLLGLVNGMRALPFLLTGPLGGVIADRVNRRNLMMTTQMFLVAVTLGMGILIATGQLQIWHLFAFTLLTGVTWSFNQPVRQAVVADVVSPTDLPNAIALNSAGFNMTRIVGPSIGGLLIAWVGAAGNFFVQGIAYCGVVLMIALMRVPPTPLEARQSSMVENMREGARWVWDQPIMRTLMTLALVPVVFAMPYQSLMPIFAQDVFGVGPEGLGLLLSASGVGAFLGAVSVASLAQITRRRGRLLLMSLVLMGTGLIVFSQTRSMPLALIFLVFNGVFQMTYMTINQTVLQLTIPHELRGRVMSIYMLNQGLLPLGSFLAGFVSHLIGAPATVALMGASCIVLAGMAAWGLPALQDIA